METHKQRYNKMIDEIHSYDIMCPELIKWCEGVGKEWAKFNKGKENYIGFSTMIRKHKDRQFFLGFEIVESPHISKDKIVFVERGSE